MKHIIRITTLSLLLLLPLFSTQAQTEAVGGAAGEGTNVFIQSAPTASLIEAANGGYTLTLSNTAAFTPWVTPDFKVNSVDNIDMQTNWDDSSAPALMKVGAMSISLTLTGLRYDAQNNLIEYSAEVVNIDAPSGEATLPSAMQDVTLVIPADLDLMLTLVVGDDFVGFNEMSNVRAAIDEDCSVATLSALEALLPQAEGEQAEAIQAALDACAEAE